MSLFLLLCGCGVGECDKQAREAVLLIWQMPMKEIACCELSAVTLFALGKVRLTTKGCCLMLPCDDDEEEDENNKRVVAPLQRGE